MSVGIKHRPPLGLGAGNGNERSTFDRSVRPCACLKPQWFNTRAAFRVQQRAIERLWLEGRQAGGAAWGDVYGLCCDSLQAAV